MGVDTSDLSIGEDCKTNLSLAPVIREPYGMAVPLSTADRKALPDPCDEVVVREAQRMFYLPRRRRNCRSASSTSTWPIRSGRPFTSPRRGQSSQA